LELELWFREKSPISSAKFAVPVFVRRSRHEAFSGVREERVV
jgi:hypothetical protein